MDPRHKLQFYEDELKSNDENAEERSRVYHQVKEIYDQQYSKPDETHVESQSVSRVFKKRRLTITSELNRYLNEYPLATPQQDPINWWKTHSTELPQLSLMARDYLAIPGTSASSERAFSGGRRLITDTRTRLNDQSIRSCICLKNWIDNGVYSMTG